MKEPLRCLPIRPVIYELKQISERQWLVNLIGNGKQEFNLIWWKRNLSAIIDNNNAIFQLAVRHRGLGNVFVIERNLWNITKCISIFFSIFKCIIYLCCWYYYMQPNWKVLTAEMHFFQGFCKWSFVFEETKVITGAILNRLKINIGKMPFKNINK